MTAGEDDRNEERVFVAGGLDYEENQCGADET